MRLDTEFFNVPFWYVAARDNHPKVRARLEEVDALGAVRSHSAPASENRGPVQASSASHTYSVVMQVVRKGGRRNFS